MLRDAAGLVVDSLTYAVSLIPGQPKVIRPCLERRQWLLCVLRPAQPECSGR